MRKEILMKMYSNDILEYESEWTPKGGKTETCGEML